MDEIKGLIINISDIQKDFYINLEEKEVKHRINYSKKRIDDFYKDSQLVDLFVGYYDIYSIEISNLVFSKTIRELQYDYSDYLLRVRVKEKKSLTEKIDRYKNNHTQGRVSIQKCINDILGFRIITGSNYIGDEKFKAMCENLQKDKVISRFYVKNEGDYKGIHLYFKNKSNLYLPWELQIWFKNHERDNTESHKSHKKII